MILIDRAKHAAIFAFAAIILFATLAATLVFVPIAPVTAALPLGDAPAEVAPEPPASTISTDRDAGDDDRIAARLRAIYAAIPDLEGIEVEVAEGVVTLSGMAADGDAITRAEEIAARPENVVTVQNDIERDASLGDDFGLGGVAEKSRNFLALVPLIGAALIVALVIAGLGYIIAGFKPLWQRVAPNSFMVGVIQTAIRFIFVVGGLVIALDMLGAGALLGAVLGGAGVIGLALGFAMRDTVENYVASLMLSLRQPFRANDHVLIDDLEGRVIRLNSRATILMTLDGNHLRIPNATVFKAIILNYTTNPQRRFEFDLGVDADDDAAAARTLVIETLKSLPYILGDPPPEVRITEVGDSNVVIRSLAWIDQNEADFYKARSRTIPAVKVALEDAGFGLPEPIYRLRFDPRSASVPFENIGGENGAKSVRTGPPLGPGAKSAPAPDTHDVAPDDEIARMVDKERSTGGEPDLLDSDRPKE